MVTPTDVCRLCKGGVNCVGIATLVFPYLKFDKTNIKYKPVKRVFCLKKMGLRYEGSIMSYKGVSYTEENEDGVKHSMNILKNIDVSGIFLKAVRKKSIWIRLGVVQEISAEYWLNTLFGKPDFTSQSL